MEGAVVPASRLAAVLGLALLAVALVPTGSAVGGLTDLVVHAVGQRAGDTETWTLSYGSPTAGNANGNTLVWTVPSGFVLQSPVCSLDGATGVLTAVAGQTVSCKIGSGFYALGATMRWTVTNVKAPTYAQTTPAFVTEYRNAADVPIASDATATATILANTLQSVSATALDKQTGVTTTWNFAFTTKNPVSADGDLRLVLPAGFELQNNAACSIAGLSGLSFNRVSATEAICNLNGASLASGTAYTLAVSGVKNPLYAQTYQAPSLQTRTATDALHDTVANIGLSLDPRHFLETPKATPGSAIAGQVTYWDFEMKLSNPLPANDYVAVTFPAGFQFNQGGTTAFEVLSGTSGHFEPAVWNGNKVGAKLADGVSVPEGATLKIRITHIQNPQTNLQDPSQSEEVQLVLSLVNDVFTFLSNAKNDVETLLFPCDPSSADCCPSVPSDCPSPPCSDPSDNSPECCQANRNCPSDPTCTQLRNCPKTRISSGPGGNDGGGGAGDDTPTDPASDDGGGGLLGGAIYRFFTGSGPFGKIGSLVGVLGVLVLLGGLGGGGYYGYAVHRRKKTKRGTLRANAIVSDDANKKP